MGSMKRPLCPKCGKAMTRGGRTPAGKLRWECRGSTGDRQRCYNTTNPMAGGVRKQDGTVKRPAKQPVFTRTIGKTASRFFVTAAQNATPAHAGFIKALEVACEHLSAELLVIPLRYKNPTSRWTKSQENEDIWDPLVTPYLYNKRIKLNQNIVALGDIKTQPTAVSPLTGFEAITHGESAILGHTKLQLTVVPAPQNRLPKILTTTGACTVPNYTDSKTGKLGEFHHTMGAALVEVRGKKFHLRQIQAAPNGEFQDLDTWYGYAEGVPVVRAEQRIDALVMGDTHVDFIDPLVRRATLEGTDSIAAVLQPDLLVWHDLLDAYAVNPHHAGNPFIRLVKHRTKRDDIAAEVGRAIDFVKRYSRPDRKSLIVPSNHSDFLRRWVLNHDWKMDPANAEFYLDTALAMVRSAKMTPRGVEYPDPFAELARKRMDAKSVIVLPADGSFTVRGIELGMHGDHGPNGARGSRRNLRRIGVKSIIGHSHTPGIEEGCWQTGTSTHLRLEYNRGPSNWLNSHVLVYQTGKRTIVNVIEGGWRL